MSMSFDSASGSPLVVIRQKELELERRLTEARDAAERAVRDAQEWATKYLNQAEKEGLELAESYYLAELKAVDEEAEKICRSGEQEASRIAGRSAQVLEGAADLILDIILPQREPED
ncbi:MAG: hypothetical protein HY650_13580 [Acidobacteria bacterium]|nr:hypothetical protein [Acidobacteriota bacterium]